MGMGGQRHAPAALPPGMTRYPLYRRLGGPKGRCGRVRKIPPPKGFDPRTVQPVASRYTDWAIPAHIELWAKLNWCGTEANNRSRRIRQRSFSLDRNLKCLAHLTKYQVIRLYCMVGVFKLLVFVYVCHPVWRVIQQVPTFRRLQMKAPCSFGKSGAVNDTARRSRRRNVATCRRLLS
jgi:hypothetical protein